MISNIFYNSETAKIDGNFTNYVSFNMQRFNMQRLRNLRVY